MVEVGPSGQSWAASLRRWPWAKQARSRQGDCFLDVGRGGRTSCSALPGS